MNKPTTIYKWEGRPNHSWLPPNLSKKHCLYFLCFCYIKDRVSGREEIRQPSPGLWWSVRMISGTQLSCRQEYSYVIEYSAKISLAKLSRFGCSITKASHQLIRIFSSLMIFPTVLRIWIHGSLMFRIQMVITLQLFDLDTISMSFGVFQFRRVIRNSKNGNFCKKCHLCYSQNDQMAIARVKLSSNVKNTYKLYKLIKLESIWTFEPFLWENKIF